MNFKLFHTVHLDGRRRGHDPTWKCIRHMWLQEAHMKNRVNLNGTWQVQTKRGGPDLLQDLIRTKATNIEFSGRTSGVDVAAQQPHVLADDKRRGLPTMPIS